MRTLAPVTLALLSLCRLVAADEGMWTFNRFPAKALKEAYGFEPTKAWLDHVRLSSVRLAQGCSGSIVSPDGLVLTNHHCAHECLEQLSSAGRDYVKDGFFAESLEQEPKCPELEVNQLIEIVDVTDRINRATAGLTGAAFNDALKAEQARIEKECARSDDLRCDVVTLYAGGRYDLYKYRRYQDIRLVFAPEFSVAFFGGDPDNFMFPRYDLDMALLRIWKGDKPAKTDHWLRWSKGGPAEGELVFTSGHPGRTSRQFTVAQLEYLRDEANPARLLRLAEQRGMLREFQNRGEEQRRVSNATRFYVENSYKAYLGMWGALKDQTLMEAKRAEEKALRERVAADPALAVEVGGAWDAIAKAMKRMREIRKTYSQLEQGLAFWSDSFAHARILVRAATELTLPNEKRLREYGDSRIPALRQTVLSEAPISEEFEVAKLAFSLEKMREELGPDHPVVRKVLGPMSPVELATSVVKGTKLRDVNVRKALWEGGKAAVDASDDPMIRLARLVDEDSRAIRKVYEDEIESVVAENSQKIAKARFKVLGTTVAPDATFTLRLSYGTVKGWVEDGRPVHPFTDLRGAFERHTGRDPFALPERWLAAKDRLDLSTPFNFCSDNDIVGGNSGSPVVDREGRLVGLVFDGNIHSLGGDYGFDPKVNRMVAVHSRAIIEALDKIYGAKRILKELGL